MAEKILVIDDSKTNRMLIGNLLKSSGYEIIEAGNGKEGIELAVEKTPDIILLDVIMPDVDGYDICKSLKNNEKTLDIPVIFLSSKSETTDKIKGLRIGGVDYITKPFNERETLARVRCQLNIRKLRNEIIQANKELIKKQKVLEEDLKVAADIQRTLLPQTLPSFENLDIAWRFLPSERVGGDIFNIFYLDEDHVGLYMLDVSGHGVPSAMVTVSVSQMLHPHNLVLSKNRLSSSRQHEIVFPRTVLNALDDEYPLERFGKYFTIVYLIINIKNGKIIYSRAAHPPPVLILSDGTLELLEEGGTVIGIGKLVPFEEGRKNLKCGNKIIIYTDGITEYQDDKNNFYGEDRFYSLLNDLKDKPIDVMLDEIIESLKTFSCNTPPRDDVSILGIEYKGKSLHE